MKIGCKTITVVLLIISSPAFSQNSFQFGLKAGGTFSTLSGDFGNAKPSLKAGAHFGVMADIKLSKKFVFSPELLFMMKGIGQTQFGTNSNGAAQYIDETITINYFEVPLLVKLKLQNGFHFDLGPYISFLNNVDYYVNINTGTNAAVLDTTLTNDFVSVDFGLIAGFGYQLDEDLGINARYEYGLTDVNKYGRSNLYANRAIVLSLSFFL